MTIHLSGSRTMLRVGALALGTAVVVGGAAAPASAKRGDVIKRSTCSNGALAKLKLSPENGRIETEFEVDSNRNGQVWTVRLYHNGTRVTKVNRTTHAPSGSFSVRRLLGNRAGTDTVKATAVYNRTGARCSVTASF
jgi:hypothetical protein